MALVYVATNKVNGKRYIGVTTTPLSERRYAHHAVAKRGAKTRIHAALRKYGFDAFEWRVMHDYLFTEDAQEAEVRFIKTLKPEYNIVATQVGVRGLKHTPEQREKIAKQWTPERRAQQAEIARKRLLSPEAAAKSRASTALRKGKPNLHALGRKHSPESIKKMSDAAIARRHIMQENIKAAQKATARPVICLDDGLAYSSASAAGKFYGLNPEKICPVAAGVKHYNTVKGKRFIYADRIWL